MGKEGGAKNSRMDRIVHQTWMQEGAERRTPPVLLSQVAIVAE